MGIFEGGALFGLLYFFDKLQQLKTEGGEES